jgi:hypothetical protein
MVDWHSLFPELATERELLGLINRLLLCDDRWSYELRDVPSRLTVDLRWNADGVAAEASAIGFAPLGTMPVTRRAPFTALGLWSSGFRKAFRFKPDEFMGVGDMNHDMPEPKYRSMHTATRKRVSQVRDVLTEAGVATGVTFCLSKDRAPDLVNLTWRRR